MALTKVINDLADLNQSGSTNALKGCRGTTAQQPASSSTIEYLIVGGGGGNGTLTGGAGAGGLLTGTTIVYHETPTVITVGEGGPAGPGSYPDPLWARNGDDSGFNGIRALGGGSGGSHGVSNNGIDGGSGGGATSSNSLYSGGSGTTDQGMGGGANSTSSGYGAGGGGGAGNPAGDANGTGGTGTSALGGTGGCGTNMNSFISSTNANLAQVGDVSGSDVFFAGGGGGGIQEANTGGTPFGGPTYPEYANGGGGHGAADGNASQAGLRNTGGGAGGPGYKTSHIWGAGAEGGSGVAILKYNNTIVTGYTLNSEDTYTVNWPADKYGAGYWPLNLDVKDVGGNYDGTATDITYTNGQFNQAASFNGSSSVIKATQPAQSENFTVSAWVKTTVSGSWDVAVGMGGVYGVAANGLSMWISASTNSLHASWGNGTNEDYWTTSPTTLINTGAWFHVAITVNNIASPTVKGYINGVLEGSGSSGTDPITYKPNEFSIGAREHDGGTVDYYWNGEIEQVRFYGSELSITDIQDIYNNSKPGSLPPLTTASDISSISTLNYPSGTTGKALYQFQGNADELSDSALDFTNTSVSFTDGKFGEAATFDGTTSYLTLTSGLGSVANRTRSCWFYVDSVPSSFTTIIYIGESGSNSNYEVLSISAASSFQPRVRFQGRYGSSGSPSDSSIQTSWDVQAETWYHAAWVYDGTTQYLYVNGMVVGTATLTVTDTSSGITRVGAWRDGTPSLDGKVDQLRFYNEALSADNIYKLWRETNIQTYITNTTSSTDANGTPANTDILVFKEGSGEITFKNDTPPGAEIGMLRYNSTLGQMEHFNSGGWKDFTNCTTSICNYPVTARCLYTFDGDIVDACGNTSPDYLTGISYTAGKFGQGFRALGSSSDFGYSRIGWSSGLGVNYNTSDFSISVWLKQYSYASYSACGNNSLCYGYIFSGWSNSYWTLDTAGTTSGNTIRWNSWGPGAGQIQSAESGIVDLNTWYHIVATRSTTDGIQLWLNNQLVASVSGAFTAGAASVYDMIGGYGDTGYTRQGLNGSISQFRLFESVLTPAQISQLYNEVYCP